MAWDLEREIAEKEWDNDPQSLENQQWRSPARWHDAGDFDQVDAVELQEVATGTATRRKPFVGGSELPWGPSMEGLDEFREIFASKEKKHVR